MPFVLVEIPFQALNYGVNTPYLCARCDTWQRGDEDKYMGLVWKVPHAPARACC